MGLKTWWNKPVASCESIRWPAEAAPAESPNRVTLITTIVIILIWSLSSFLNVSIAYRLHNQYHKMLRNKDIQDAKENSLANSPNSVIAITVLTRSVVIITIIWIKITWKGLLQNRQYSSAPTPGQRPCPEETENENCIFTFHHHHWKKTVKNLVPHLISSGLLCVEAKEAKRTESLKYYLVEKYSGNQA